jgi:hypothetical protein
MSSPAPFADTAAEPVPDRNADGLVPVKDEKKSAEQELSARDKELRRILYRHLKYGGGGQERRFVVFDPREPAITAGGVPTDATWQEMVDTVLQAIVSLGLRVHKDAPICARCAEAVEADLLAYFARIPETLARIEVDLRRQRAEGKEFAKRMDAQKG